ncbi:MAG: DeoR family transcriptional regulator [Parcubacteria group bacterium]
MDKDFLVQLAKKIYHLTVLFPKKEPLRYKMRELAIEILQKPDEQDFETLNNFFEVARDQNWVKSDDILAIQKEYANLSGEIIEPKQKEKLFDPSTFQGHSESLKGDAVQDKTKIESKARPLIAKTLIERHEKILAILKERGKAQVWEMKQVFPQISKRTLRRDFEFLFKQGVIDRMGEKNNTYYQVKIG